MKLSKQLGTTLMASMLVFITACGGGGGTVQSPSPGGENGNGGDKPKEDTITVWTYPVHATYEDDLKEMIADFNKDYPHIKVEYEVLSWAEGPQKFDIALNSGNPPDIYWGSVHGQYINSGLAVPLDDYLTDDIKNDFIDGALDLGKVQGVQYVIPHYQSIWAWTGNKKLLEEAGVDWQKIQEEGWTWSEFNEIAPTLTKKLDNGRTQYGFVSDGTLLDLLDILSHNADLEDVVDRDGNFIWNDDRILDTLSFIDNMIKSGVSPKEMGALTPQARLDMYYAEEAAIISKGLPYYDVMVRNRNADIDAGKVTGEKIDFVLLPPPHKDDVPYKSTGGGEGYYMFKQKNDKGEEHRQNAFLVMEALSGAKGGVSANELCLPFLRKSQAEYFEGKANAQEYNQRAAEIMSQSPTLPVDLFIDLEVSGKIRQFKEQVVKPNYQALLAGEKTPQQAADEIKSKGEQTFK